jgi:hypothetical protein
MDVSGLTYEGAQLPGEAQEPANTAATNRPTIYWLGDRTYRVGESDPVPVNESEDAILQAFLGHPTLDLKALARRSNLDANHVRITLGRLRKKWDGLFVRAIFCPGKGGKGKGYRATVLDARMDSET